ARRAALGRGATRQLRADLHRDGWMETIHARSAEVFGAATRGERIRPPDLRPHGRASFDRERWPRPRPHDSVVAMASTKAVPRHIAIIMDGNGRWAKARGLPRIKGHEQGAQAARECVEGCAELKVEYLTLYAFSAENWQRPKTEVMALMRLLEKFLKEKTPELLEKNVRLQAIGRLTDLPLSCQRQLHESIERTAANDGLTLILALSYGARL